MYKKALNKFLNQSIPEESKYCAAAISHFVIKASLTDPDELEKLASAAMEESAPDEIEETKIEKMEIEAITSNIDLIRTMRRETVGRNRSTIVKKALEMESEVVPEIVRRFKTNMIDGFLELTIHILARSSLNMAEEIIAYYNEMRNPYAQSLALLYLGFKAEEDCIPWMIEQFYELQKKYPTEDFCYGAYYGLVEMYDRFYE